MNKKVDYTKAEQLQDQTYFDCKIDMVPASLKTTYSELVSKNPVLVSRELIVDGRPLIGIEYTPNGEVASVYTTDIKGKRVNFENSAEHADYTSKDLITQHINEVSRTISRKSVHTENNTISTPKAKKERVVPEALKKQPFTITKSQERA